MQVEVYEDHTAGGRWAGAPGRLVELCGDCAEAGVAGGELRHYCAGAPASICECCGVNQKGVPTGRRGGEGRA